MRLNLCYDRIIFLTFFILLGACKKEKQSQPQVDNSNVYIAVNNSDSSFYWNNGITTPLPGYPANASGIAVSGNNTYVSGFVEKDNHYRAVYWKNGLLSLLPGVDTTVNSSAAAISISNNNIFLVGWPAWTTQTSLVWENGVLDNLPNGQVNGVSSAMVVSGSDIYIAGTDTLNGYDIATYWKNGTKIHLMANIRSYATAIFVVGNDIYVAGYYINSEQSPAIPAYWKNGILTNLSTSWGMANSIFVDGNDVYVCGVNIVGNNKYATVWKNGAPTYLTTETNWSIANTMCVSNGVVYVAGVIQDPRFGTITAAYWRNGEETIIGTSGSIANSIFVK